MDNFSDRMGKLFDEMQAAYDNVARHYDNFNCMGCTDNCCTQRFFHHTIAEYRYLKLGLIQAVKSDPDLVRKMLQNAIKVVDAYKVEHESGEVTHPMCPVNFEGLCRLYEHRPMICRMHGLPHRFRKPDGREERGGGCAKFGEAHKTDWTVNRTNLYKELSHIEGDVRSESRVTGKYARTTAEMLVDMIQEEESLRALMEK